MGLESIWIDQEKGSVRLCAWANYRLGNLTENSIEELWNGEKAEEFRKSMLDGSYRYCDDKKCPYRANHTLSSMMVDYEIPQYPRQCNLSYEEACNYVCRFCRTEKYFPRKEESKNIEIIEREIQKFINQLDVLSANGVGELFCSPSIMNVLRNVSNVKKTKIWLESNGSLFNKRNWDKISNIGEHQLDVYITVHSFNEKTYQFLSGTTLTVDHIIDNLLFIKELRKKEVINYFEIATVVCERNFREMPDYIKRCLEFEPDKIRLRFFEPYGVRNKSDEWFYDIRNPYHPYYEEFKEIMEHPILKHPKVWKWQGESVSDQKEHPYFKEKKKVKILNQLITMEHVSEKVRDYCKKYRIGKIGLYGYGLVGQAFASFLDNQKIEFGTIFDSFAQDGCDYKGHKIRKPCKEELKEYDLIIITSEAFEMIIENLKRLEYDGIVKCLEDIIF